jgi:dipeptidyl aminopeptidase/acylaminoacyl peptidase
VIIRAIRSRGRARSISGGSWRWRVLVDGVDWAVAQGYADPDRVAIVGGSYGGYAALIGATVTPDRFAAAVDYVGISDLANFMATLPLFVRANMQNTWIAYVGDPDDPEQLADIGRRSPITMVGVHRFGELADRRGEVRRP